MVFAAIRNCLSDEYFIREERLVQRVAAQLLCQNFRQRATVQKIVAELPASCEDFERKWVRENGSSNGQRLYYWYTLDKIPIPPECLRLPIWAYVALHITAGARMLVCVRMDSFSWPDGRPCRVAWRFQDQWHSSPRHASGSVSARQRGAPGTGSSRSCSRRAPTQRPPPAWAGGACVSASRLALPTGGRAATARPRWRVDTASGIELSDGTSPHAALGGVTPAHRRSHRSLSQRR